MGKGWKKKTTAGENVPNSTAAGVRRLPQKEVGEHRNKYKKADWGSVEKKKCNCENTERPGEGSEKQKTLGRALRQADPMIYGPAM